MKVFKFGGASVKDATAVKNVYNIISKYPEDRLFIVFSAMGKTTNALEKVVEALIKRENFEQHLTVIKEYHYGIARELGINLTRLEYWFKELDVVINSNRTELFDEAYDKIVSFGELLSTSIISTFLESQKFDHQLLDARELVITEKVHRNAPINWETTLLKTRLSIEKITKKVIITQGFISSTLEGETTTLGREGSDFSAAIFAWALDVEEMIIWKDVPGVLNADPRYFSDTIKLDKMSYRDAIELAYYGASVIHPKTIQPLQSKKITLQVKSFYYPEEPGTIISAFDEEHGHQIPSYIFKPDQVLVSISPRDFSFIAEDNLHEIFGLLASLGIHFNMMQHSAISFSIVMDNNPDKVHRLFTALGSDFRVRYNSDLQLITIRYYDQATIDKVIDKREIYLEQKSRTTVQLVVGK